MDQTLPASFTTGERIRHLRERRGMTRPVLAGLVGGYSADWLKRIERGDRGVSVPALLRLARVLRIDDLAVLIDGDIPIPVSAWDGPPHAATEAVRAIVGSMTFRRRERDDLNVPALAARLDQAWRDWHTLPDNHTAVAGVLPGLIADLEAAAVANDGPEWRAAQAGLASAYGLAQHLSVDMVEPETGRILVDRAARAAQAADDPVSLAFGAWTYGHVLRGGDAEAALRIVGDAADQLAPYATNDDHAAGLLGSLNLHMAISAAHLGEEGHAWRYWDAAETIQRRMPFGYFHPQTIFSESNVAIHGVSVAADLRRFGEAVARSERVDVEAIPSRERRGRLFGEKAAGHLQRRDWEPALRWLDRSFVTSPEEAPFSPLTRGVAVELVRNTRGSLHVEAVDLAERMGVLPGA